LRGSIEERSSNGMGSLTSKFVVRNSQRKVREPRKLYAVDEESELRPRAGVEKRSEGGTATDDPAAAQMREASANTAEGKGSVPGEKKKEVPVKRGNLKNGRGRPTSQHKSRQKKENENCYTWMKEMELYMGSRLATKLRRTH